LKAKHLSVCFAARKFDAVAWRKNDDAYNLPVQRDTRV